MFGPNTAGDAPAAEAGRAMESHASGELVLGDVIKLQLGAVVAVAIRIIEGSIEIHQSMLI